MEILILFAIAALIGGYFYEKKHNAAKTAALVAAVKADLMNLELTVKAHVTAQAVSGFEPKAAAVVADVEAYVIKMKAKL